jgi:hypothetical protein
MPFFKIQCTDKFADDHQGNSFMPHEIHIVLAESEKDARKILSACCGAQYGKTVPSNNTDFGPFNDDRYFTCEEVTEVYVDQNYPEILGNPSEVRYPKVDEHYFYNRSPEDKG